MWISGGYKFVIIFFIIITLTHQMQSYEERKNREQIEWKKDHEIWMRTHQCMNCGSNHITQAVGGKPYTPYYQFHRKLSQKLGWETVDFTGCTQTRSDYCAECKSENIRFRRKMISTQ